jgi:hypothetical protein
MCAHALGATAQGVRLVTVHRFSFPTDIHFGPGARRGVAPHLRGAGCGRPLLVTDRALAALPVLAEFRGLLDGWTLRCTTGARQPDGQPGDGRCCGFRAHRADSVIGFGGGRGARDVARFVGVMAWCTRGRRPSNMRGRTPRCARIERPLPYLRRAADHAAPGPGRPLERRLGDDSHLKRVVSRQCCQGVFADPELTLACRPQSPRPPAWTR